MNRVELLIYNFVKDNPELKRRIVRAYQLVCGMVPQARIKSKAPVVVRKGYFFGFHDKTPFSADNKLLLGHRALIADRSVRSGEAAEVGVFSGAHWQKFYRLGETRAWDWQLGSMLQWRGRSGSELVFNDIVDGRVGSRVVSSDGRPVADLPRPVVHVSPCGQWASSYCFRRVGKAMPGYGVRIAGDESVSLHQFTGLGDTDFAVFSLLDGSTRFSVTLDAIRSIEPHPSMVGAFHFFHHSLFNPSGTRLFFFHRWVDFGGRRWTRMFACEATDGGGLQIFPTHEMVSHVGWIDDRRVLAYARTATHGDGYYILDAGGSSAVRVADRSFNSDGHPMWSPRGGAFVTDSYPDRFRNQYLYIYDMKRESAITILRTHLGRKFLDDLQVDLHPRFDRTGGVISFDSGHTGTRSLCTVDISGIEIGS